MELDRHFIERTDFQAARRGYDPDEVDRHLREIADAVNELKRQQKPSPASLATAAAEQVRSIVEAAEKSAAEIQENAETEARRITEDASRRARETRERADADAVQRVQSAEEATQRALDRAGSIEGEIDRLLGDLRSAANGLVERVTGASGTLQGELDQLRGEFASVREARLEEEGRASAVEDEGPVDAEPEIVAEGEDVQAEIIASDGASIADEADEGVIGTDGSSIVDEAAGPDTAVEDEVAAEELEEEEPEPEPEPEPATTGGGGGGGGRSIRGAEGARLIALNMALNGTPRDETARYLSQNFELDDQDALLDEVYARVGG
ncbi:MAG: DivIVA domain-containing protein [Actinomycetota bacterium]|nr:DivIVA domain-containing protein [Actinomycetota bacterium]